MTKNNLDCFFLRYGVVTF